MSKERELLKRVRDALRELKETHYNLYWDIQSMLDQPEQTEQAPVAWMYDWNTKGEELYGNSYYDRVSSDEMAIKRYACDNIRPLYTTPKREPLSNEWLEDNIGLIHRDVSFTDLVRAVEKAHGIGGEE